MGSNRINAFLITDYLIALSIIKDETIAKAIYEDGELFKIPDVVNEFWIGISLDGVGIIGCYRVHQLGTILWQGHAFMLPQFRKEYSVLATRAAIDFAFDKIPDLQKIMTCVPSLHENVLKHVKLCGFTEESVIKDSYLKNGQIYDRHFLSITKE